MNTTIRQIATGKQAPWIYLIIAVVFSWIFWIPATFIQGDIPNSPWMILLYIGGLGPALGGIGLTYLNLDRKVRKPYWNRVYDPRRINAWWYPVILLAYPALTCLILYLEQGRIQLTNDFNLLLTQPAQLLTFLVFLLVFGPLPEELGWRGFALEELQKQINPVISSAIVGAVWAVWHIPLFLMRGTYQYQLGFGSTAFWQFMISAFTVSIFFTWIYNHNRSSILSAVLFHFSINLTGNLLQESSSTITWRILAMIILAGILIAISSRTFVLGFQKKG